MTLSSIRTNLLSVTLILCILCSVTVTPVMASQHRETVVEDGVHLVKFDDSPTILDSRYYHIEQNMDFVIDGNQFYWVRIGNVKSAELSSNQIANLLCKGAIVIGAAILAYYLAPEAAGETIATITLKGGTTLSFNVAWIGSALGAVVGYVGSELQKVCSVVEKYFVDHKYRVVASDGTILVAVKKDNTQGITELKNQGLDIQHLQHFTKEGILIRNPL